MRRLLLGTAMALCLSMPSQAAVIDNLGINPTSATGAFSNSVGGGAFSDQYTFQLVGGPQFFTIASVTNVYPNPTDFITNFNGSVLLQVGAIGGGDDVTVIGPVFASACPFQVDCQGFAGSAILNAGNYYLNIAGVGGGTSGYGGNIATAAAIPGPLAGAGLPGLLFALGGGAWLQRRRRQRQAA